MNFPNLRKVPILRAIIDVLDDKPFMTLVGTVLSAIVVAKLPGLDEYRDIFIALIVVGGGVIAGSETIAGGVAKTLNRFSKPLAGIYQAGIDGIEGLTGYDIPDSLERENVERVENWLSNVTPAQLEAIFARVKAKQTMKMQATIKAPPPPPPDSLNQV